ncbi:MAG: hypothetical protein HY815_05510 [Candidatus Riflebacteria bacterium]|nr:hypothetical protein [Candidatus Riflebacteria bacterium]
MTRITMAAMLVLLGLSPAVLTAGLPVRTTIATAEEFDKGELTNVSLSSEGNLRLSPAIAFVDLPVDASKAKTDGGAQEMFAWCTRATRSGSLLVGTGNGGLVLRRASGGAGPLTVMARTGELIVTSLTEDDQGNVYAGTIPNGKIFKIAPSGRTEVHAQVPAPYVWAVGMLPGGDLVAATGPEGALYVIGPDCQPKQRLKTAERNLMSLLVASADCIYVGTEPSGLVLRVDSAGKATTLFDAPQAEIRALALDSRGKLYVAATTAQKTTPPGGPGGPPPASPIGPGPVLLIGKTTAPSPAPPGKQAPSPAPAGGAGLPAAAGEAKAEGPPAVPEKRKEPGPLIEGGPPDAGRDDAKAASRSTAPTKFGRKGVDANQAVYSITPEGAVTQVLSASQSVLLCLAIDDRDRVHDGTGNEGTLFMIDGVHVTKLAKLEVGQVLTLAALPGKGMAFGTGNPARVGIMGPDAAQQGFWVSEPRDFTSLCHWGSVGYTWDGAPAGAVKLSTRSGNSARPDETWFAWAPATSRGDGLLVGSPAARYMQLRVDLSAGDRSTSPRVSEVWLVSRQVNLPPEIEKFEVGLPVVDPISDPRDVESREGQKEKKKKKREPPALRHLKWEASDPNEDRLSFSLAIRGEGESAWRVLSEREIMSTSMDWDTQDFPDGRYRLRLVASDRGSNPSEVALAAERVSEPFLLDATPPRVELTEVVAGTGVLDVSGLATDGPGSVVNVEYAVDDADYRMLQVTDGIADSPREEFRLRLTGLATGEHTLSIRAHDELGNVGSARRTVTIR